jgi:hypothetical protein
MLKCYNSRAPKGAKDCQNDVIRYLPQRQGNCDSGGMLYSATQAQMAPPPGYRRISVSGAIWHPEKEYGRICNIYIYMAMCYYLVTKLWLPDEGETSSKPTHSQPVMH